MAGNHMLAYPLSNLSAAIAYFQLRGLRDLPRCRSLSLTRLHYSEQFFFFSTMKSKFVS